MTRRIGRAQAAVDDPSDATDDLTAGAAQAEPAAGKNEEDHDSAWERQRRDILDAAAEVFFHKGYDRGTTKEIAARVGLSQPAIYHYVGGKEELLVEIARQVDSDFTAGMVQALARSSDPVEQLRNLIYAFTDALARNQLSFALYWKEYRAIPASAAKSVSAHHRAFVEKFTELVAEAQKLGALPADHPTDIIAQGILGMLSWMYWWYRPESPSTPDDIARGFLALLGLQETPDA